MAADRAKVYLVGAGPGDPDLLTLKGARILAQAEAVIYDKFVSPEILALANPQATFIPARKERGQQEEFEAEIHAWYLRLRDATGPVVRLKSGDPFGIRTRRRGTGVPDPARFRRRGGTGRIGVNGGAVVSGHSAGGRLGSGDGTAGASASGERRGLAGLPAWRDPGGPDGRGPSRGDREMPDQRRAAGSAIRSRSCNLRRRNGSA